MHIEPMNYYDAYFWEHRHERQLTMREWCEKHHAPKEAKSIFRFWKRK